ncbi:unnamed protein product [Ectocarpus sp. 12 AP-2014]
MLQPLLFHFFRQGAENRTKEAAGIQESYGRFGVNREGYCTIGGRAMRCKPACGRFVGT